MSCGIYLTGACGQSGQLYRARNEEKRGRGTKEAVEECVSDDTETFIQVQNDCGCDFVADPMLSWFYLFQPFAENVDGISEGPQENWFNNNVFYRRPQIQGPVSQAEPGFVSKRLKVDQMGSCTERIAFLPSPYTMLKLSDVSGYANDKEAIKDLATLIRKEAEHLASQGFTRIQFDEPALAMKQSLGSLTQEDLDLCKEGIEQALPNSEVSTCLHCYFGDTGPLMSWLNALPVTCIGIDCTETREKDICAQDFSNKELALGLVDARTPAMESPKELAEKIKRISSATHAKKVWLTPNTGLEYIGWTLGKDKIDILKRTKEELASHE